MGHLLHRVWGEVVQALGFTIQRKRSTLMRDLRGYLRFVGVICGE